jgi:membrane protein DedA with SNARE-associated domain
VGRFRTIKKANEVIVLSAILLYILNQVTGFISGLGYWGIAVCMAIESCNIPLPSEMIQPFGGYLVSTGRLSFWPAVLAGTVGGTFGSVVSYYLGYFAMDSRLLFWVSSSKKEQLNRWFERYGEKTAFFSRLVPGVRTFISLPAGAARMNLPRFVGYTFLGSFLWSMMLTYVGYILGANWRQIQVYFHGLDLIVILALGCIIGYYLLRWRKHRRNEPSNG